jgi:UDP-GlcNAc:undecaprenyl-phosphate GlcNAc-1-phosphate transferase
MPTSYLVSLVSALLVTALLIPIARRVALRTDFVDHPGHAKFHTDPTPYLGGAALAAATLLSLGAGAHFVPRLSVLVLTGVALSAIGLVDDRRNLSAWFRLGAQVAAGVTVVGVGVVARVTGVAIIDDVLTIGWIVVVTNSFNLLDNMDGLSAGTAAVSALGVAVLAAVHQQMVIGPVAMALVGSCLGFLLYNWEPAAIFMGDSGSLFLGFFVAVLAVGVRSSVSIRGGVVVTLLLVAVPLLDTGSVVVARLSHHRSIFLGGRDHLSHRLVLRGAQPGGAVTLLIATQLALSIDAVAVGTNRLNPVAGVVFGACLLAVIAALAVPARVYETTLVRRRLWIVLFTGGGALAAVSGAAWARSSHVPVNGSGLAGGPLESPLLVISSLIVGVGLVCGIAWYALVGPGRRARGEQQLRFDPVRTPVGDRR